MKAPQLLLTILCLAGLAACALWLRQSGAPKSSRTSQHSSATSSAAPGLAAANLGR